MNEMNESKAFAMSRLLAGAWCVLLSGCTSQAPSPMQQTTGMLKLEPVEFYAEKLKDRSFVWNGPTSSEDRIPALHAARALACIGDASVPYLLRASSDNSIDKTSLYDALSEVGIPMSKFRTEFFRGDVKAVDEWWQQNAARTLNERTRYRAAIGLPAPNLYGSQETSGSPD